jgi:hypothetical protein
LKGSKSGGENLTDPSLSCQTVNNTQNESRCINSDARKS